MSIHRSTDLLRPVLRAPLGIVMWSGGGVAPTPPAKLTYEVGADTPTGTRLCDSTMSNGTYGPFTVTAGVATISSTLSAGTTYTDLDDLDVLAVASLRSIQHIDDLQTGSGPYLWGNGSPITANLELLALSMDVPQDYASYPEIGTAGAITGVTVTTNRVTVDATYAGGLTGYRLQNRQLYINANLSAVTLTDLAIVIDADGRDAISTGCVFIDSSGQLGTLSSLRIVLPEDYGGPENGIYLSGPLSNLTDVHVNVSAGDFMKPSGLNTGTLTMTRCVTGPGGVRDPASATAAAWDSGTTYNTGDYCTNGGFKWESKIDSNLNNEPLSEDANWYLRNPHADAFQDSSYYATINMTACVIFWDGQGGIEENYLDSTSNGVNIGRFPRTAETATAGGTMTGTDCMFLRQTTGGNPPFDGSLDSAVEAYADLNTITRSTLGADFAFTRSTLSPVDYTDADTHLLASNFCRVVDPSVNITMTDSVTSVTGLTILNAVDPIQGAGFGAPLGGSTPGLTPEVPTHTTGDMLVVWISATGNAADNGITITETGWTSIAELKSSTSTTGVRIKVLYKIAASAAETVTITTDVNRAGMCVQNMGAVSALTNLSTSSNNSAESPVSTPLGTLTDTRDVWIAYSTDLVRAAPIISGVPTATELDTVSVEFDGGISCGGGVYRNLSIVKGTANATGAAGNLTTAFADISRHAEAVIEVTP